MPAIYPMSQYQLDQMREATKNAKTFQITIDDGVVLESSTSFFIWDDDNKLLYVCDENTTFPKQFFAPIRMRAFSYDVIENFICYY